MTTFELEEAVQAERELDLTSVPHSQTGIEGWKAELGAYLAEMQKFEALDPTEVFLRLSAFSARASEIRFNIITQNESRRAHVFRTQAVDPFLEVCDFQFRVFSRIQAVRDMEFKMSGGQT